MTGPQKDLDNRCDFILGKKDIRDEAPMAERLNALMGKTVTVVVHWNVVITGELGFYQDYYCLYGIPGQVSFSEGMVDSLDEKSNANPMIFLK